MKVEDGVLDPSEGATFADWVGPHLAALKVVARRHGTGDDSEDVVQEALVRAWRRRSTYQPDKGTARSWLVAITVDQSRRWSTRQKGPDSFDLLSDVPEMSTADGGADLDLRKAIQQLSRRQAEAVTWHYYVGFSMVETAQLMDCSVGTVKSTLSDARKRLFLMLTIGEIA